MGYALLTEEPENSGLEIGFTAYKTRDHIAGASLELIEIT